MKSREFYEESIKHKNLLGWSYSFEKMSFYMWLLLLRQKDYQTISYLRLLTSVFSEIHYDENKSEFLGDNMSTIWNTWKDKFKIKENTKEKVMSWLNDVIENRVEAIMEGNYRKSYYKAALIVVSYGEILETNMPDAKEEYIDYYKRKYSRRSAFSNELDELL